MRVLAFHKRLNSKQVERSDLIHETYKPSKPFPGPWEYHSPEGFHEIIPDFPAGILREPLLHAFPGGRPQTADCQGQRPNGRFHPRPSGGNLLYALRIGWRNTGGKRSCLRRSSEKRIRNLLLSHRPYVHGAGMSLLQTSHFPGGKPRGRLI